MPSSSCSRFAMPSVSELLLEGIFHITQCTQSPPGASGSSMMSAKLTVFAGAPLHANAGEVSPPLQDSSRGISPPAANAVLLSANFPEEAPAAGALACCAAAPPTQTA